MSKNKMLYDLHENQNENEILRDYLKSNVPVYLHGLTGDGKSARIKAIDTEAVIIYLRTASPDYINGKTVYEPPLMGEEGIIVPGHMLAVKPSWLIKLENVCNKDKDHLHILFFDE